MIIQNPRLGSLDQLRGFLCVCSLARKANGRSRTDDLIITSDVLYQMSYVGLSDLNYILDSLLMSILNVTTSEYHQLNFQNNVGNKNLCSLHPQEKLNLIFSIIETEETAN